MGYQETITFILEMIGTIAFAASGALVGSEQKMDSPASPKRQMLSKTRHLDLPERVAPTQSRWQSSPTK